MNSSEHQQCQCQSAIHDHKPGECRKEASSDQEDLCGECYQHLLSERAPVFQNLNQPPPRQDQRWFAAVMSSWGHGMPETLRQPLPEEHPFYTLVGRVSSEWAHIEHILDTTIWRLLGADTEDDQMLTACVTAQIMGVGPRCKAIMTLCKARGIDETVWRPYGKLMSESYDPADWRAQYVHDYWVMEGPNKATQFRGMSYKDPRFGFVEVSKDEIDKLLGKIRDFQKRASDLNAQVWGALQASQKTPA